MLEDKRLTKPRRKFRALTGLTPKEVKLWLPACCAGDESGRAGDTTPRGPVRQRHVGGGRKGQWQVPAEKRRFIVVYQNASPRQTRLGEGLAVSPARVHSWGHCLLPLRRQAVAARALLPARAPRPFPPQERAQQAPQAWISEGTARRRPRPQSPATHALSSRGTQQPPRDKHGVGVTAKTTRVGDLRQPEPGKPPDQKNADQAAMGDPRAAIWYKDTGFPGSAPPGAQPRQPQKSPAKEPGPSVSTGTIGRGRGSG